LWVVFGNLQVALYNILLIKSIKKPSEDEILENEKINLPKKSQEILDKKDILSSTDLILKKYLKNSNNS
jgi:hypothetical protein